MEITPNKAGSVVRFEGYELDDEKPTKPILHIPLPKAMSTEAMVRFVSEAFTHRFFENLVGMRTWMPDVTDYSEKTKRFTNEAIIANIASKYRGTDDLIYHHLSSDIFSPTDVGESEASPTVCSGKLNQWLQDRKYFQQELLKGGKIVAYWWRENDLYYIQEHNKNHGIIPLTNPLSVPAIVVKQMLSERLIEAGLKDQVQIIDFKDDASVGEELSANDNTEDFRYTMYLTTNQHGVLLVDNCSELENLCESLCKACDDYGNIVVLVEPCEQDDDSDFDPSESWRGEDEPKLSWEARWFRYLPPIALSKYPQE